MSPDEAEIIRVHQEFARCWNRGDARGLAALFADDGVRVGAGGDAQRGRAAIEHALDALFRGSFRGATVTLGISTVRLLGAEHALWQAPLEIFVPGGPHLRGHALDVMRKRDGRWWVLESHPRLFPAAQNT